MDILLVHPKYEREKILGVGWSSSSFIFSIIGLPLFLRGLILEGSAMLMLSLVALITTAQPVNEICTAGCVALSLGHYLGGLILACSIYFGCHANEMGVNALYQKGWRISPLNSPEAVLRAQASIVRASESKRAETII